MAKRIADKELTDRNWDQEEEGEEVSRKYTNIELKFRLKQCGHRFLVLVA